MEQHGRFGGKVCLVTGGGSGIGRAVCRQLAQEGGRVAVIDNQEAAGMETVQGIAGAGGEAIFIRTDVAVAAEVQAAVQQVAAQWRRIDVLVNNAAIMAFAGVAELEEATWDRVLAVNLRSVFLSCKYCLPYMEGGAIVNVSSVHAHQTAARHAAYAASKGGMEAFTRALSQEYPPAKVRVNCAAPGGVNTPLLWSNPTIQNMRREEVTCAEPEQVAAVICFLASGEAAAINGQTVVVDQGLLARL